MAKTIKEMSIEYGRVNYIVRYTADGEREIDEETGAEFFEDGANAVIEEIIRCFPETFCINPNEVIDNIANKIRELKG